MTLTYSSKHLKRFILSILALVNATSISFAQAPPTTFWWNDAVFYELFVRSFKDSDGDGKGDINGIISKLDYLNDGNPSTNTDLGITGLWLMPIQQSPSYHGYDVTDYYTVEQDYGTNQDFKNLIDSAHNHGIKVIIDLVMNHTSSQHPWFLSSDSAASTKRNWYIWANPAPSETGPVTSQVWYPLDGSNYFAIFWSGMPDLNYRTAEVQTEMFNMAQYWLVEMNADGFRLDAARYIIEDGSVMEDTPETIEFWKEFRTNFKSVSPNAFAVGEAWATTSISKKYVSDTTLDYVFEFDLEAAILNAANSGNTTGLHSQLDTVVASYPYLQYATFLADHDMNRVMDQLGYNVSKARVASDLLLTLPGITYMYYGEEIGMRGSGADQYKRTPLQWNNSPNAGFTTGTPWEAVNASYTTINIEAEQYNPTSLWNHYRNLIALRKNQIALRRGNYMPVSTSTTSTISFLRQYLNDNILVVSNMSGGVVSNLTLTLENAGITPGKYKMVELQGGSQISMTVDATGGFLNLGINSIPAYSTFIYKFLDSTKTDTSVTFRINMNPMISAGKFNPATQSVDIVATFNNFGADSVTTLKKDANGDGIYSITISGFPIGSTISYKYRIDSTNNGIEEFANSAFIRQYIVLEGADTITDTYQNYDPTTTSVKTQKKQIAAVYPVPTNKELFVEFSNGIAGKIQYQITDLVGTERASFSFVSDGQIWQQNIPCENLSSGVYVLTITYNGTSEVFKIVIQK
jgi:alpha-amylase